MKQLPKFCAAVAAALLAGALCIPAFAQNAALNALPTAAAAAGETVDVEITLSDTGGSVGGLQFTLNYDPAVLQYDSAALSAQYQTAKQLCMTNAPKAGQVITVYLADSAVGDGSVATLSFRALANGDAALSLSEVILTGSEKAGEELPVSAASGQLTVGQSGSSAAAATPAPAVTTAAATPAPTQAAATAAPTPTAAGTQTPAATARPTAKVSDPTAAVPIEQSEAPEAFTFGGDSDASGGSAAQADSAAAAGTEGTAANATASTAESATPEAAPGASETAQTLATYAVAIAMMLGMVVLLKKRSNQRRGPLHRL